jgi:restriction system protein
MSALMVAILAAASQPKAPDLIRPVFNGLVHSLLVFWPLLLLIALATLARVAWRLYKLRQLSRSGIAEIDTMDGQAFELFLSTLFRRLGYSVEVTKYRGDYGADLVVKKSGRKTVVQAKRWKKRVGLKAVQEAVAAKAIYGCDGALVVANREFTQQARHLARANEVELWDRGALVDRLLIVRRDRSTVAVASEQPIGESLPAASQLSGVPAMGVGELAHCTTCGVAVSAKVRDYCLARPARFGGRVYCFNDQRNARPARDDQDPSTHTPGHSVDSLA